MRRTRQLCASLIGAVAACTWLAALTSEGRAEASPRPALPTLRKVDFNRDVRPILSEHCYRCHGPDAAAVAADLRLDSYSGATADRGGYQAIVPGSPAESRLVKRITASDGYTRMPPESSDVAPLTAEQIETLKLWIESGAEYKRHWSFIPPNAPERPEVSDPAWPRQELDYFVMAGLDAAGLKPEPEADLRTLARRASLVLTGLPPSPEAVSALLADKKPRAYERYVDRLLASPRYGEHQARYWLDAVRYGDTHGLHIDNERAIYPYRDWVVRAFNENLSYDKFAMWQVAGDLLPNPTTEQLIATGFVRMNPTTNEGGAIEQEFLVKNTFDRTDTFSTVFLGLTVGCAKCHDHKYDPITQKEYYGLFAYFNSTTDSPLDGNLRAPAPAIKAPTPEQQQILDGWRAELRTLEDRVGGAEAKAWLDKERTEPPTFSPWEVSGPYSGSNFEEAYATAYPPETPGAQAAWRQQAVELGKPLPGLIGKDNSAAYLRTAITLTKGREIVLRLGSDDGIRLWVDGKLVHDNKVYRALAPDADSVKVSLHAGRNELLFKVVNGGGQDGFYLAYGDPRAERIEKSYQATRKPETSPAEKREAAAVYLTFGPDSKGAARYREVLAMSAKLEESIPLTMIAQEMPEPRVTHLLDRGQYDQEREVVQRGVPKALGSLPAGAPNNRLGLAMWLTSKSNPLLERVYVNRVWQHYFGRGIVDTAENFGIQGSWPSNPQMLDALSAQFRDSGLDVKALHRAIVTSATFRQQSAVTPEKYEADPENLLFSRGPRFRLDAEVLRDQALAVSGLIVNELGGRGVKPYQPSGLWEAVAYPTSDTAKYVQDHGEALYRRSLYLFWKRTSPPPSMQVLDAPSREACIVSRSRTNTPLQALVTMNGTQFVEASRVMAARVYLARDTDAARVRECFLLATCREPTEKETEIVLGVLAKHRSKYAIEVAEAKKLVGEGEWPVNESIDPSELAAWTMVCNLVLNLDEVVTLH